MKKIKLVALLIVTIMLFSTIVCNVFASNTTAVSGEVIPGDVNGDGVAGGDDLVRLRQYLAGYDYDENVAPFELGDGADADEDGKITLLDVVKLRRILVDYVDPDEGEDDDVTDDTLDAEYAADFTVAKVFSNNMVVQRNEQLRVWGFAPESESGKKVSASFKGMFAEALVENGEWCVTFSDCLDADVTGAEMKIYTDKKTVTFTDVLVGDVYLVMGQSNTAYTVSEHLAYDDPETQGGGVAAINPDSIIRLNRLYTSTDTSNPQLGTDEVMSDLYNSNSTWTKTTLTDTKSFSAIGYYFARHLTEQNPDIPVGLIQIAKGGAPLVSFLPNDLAEKHDSDYYDPVTGKYYSNITKEHMGRYFYNCFLAPIQNYAIAGVVWYQGESNNSLTEASKFNAAFADFMTRLRSTHNLTNKDFPVFITELPSIYQKPADYTGSSTWHYMELGLIRSYMGIIPTVLENSYVAASSDVWSNKTYANNLHPNCKYEQSARLAAIAEVVIYNDGKLDEATGPIFESATVSADKKTVVVTFSNVGAGLATADGGTAVKGIIGLDGNTIGHNVVDPESATITAYNQITVVFATEVKAVAYNYKSSDFYGDTINLCNSNGCIATAFITPYEEIELGTYQSEDFKETSYSPVNFKNRAIDTLKINGNDYFTVGKVTSELSAAGNRVEIEQGATKLAVAGWAGFGHKIIVFGYSVDGQDAVFNAYASAPGQAVINAGGQYAQRFSVAVPVGALDLGDHTIDILVLVDVEEGVAVKLLSFTLEIVEEVEPEIPEEPETPEETEKPEEPEEIETYPAFNSAGYGYKNYSIDSFTHDGTKFFESGSTLSNLKNANYTVSVTKGTGRINIGGWVGYETTIDKFGYAIDGNPVWSTNPSNADDAIINAGGENAKRFDIYMEVSSLNSGNHHIDVLVRINMTDGSQAVLSIASFTLVVEKSLAPDGFEAPVFNASKYGLKDHAFDTIAIDSTTASTNVLYYFVQNKYTVTVEKGVKKLSLNGWIGFETSIDMFGYAIDGTVYMTTNPSSAGQGVIDRGGEYAKRFYINADISGLKAGHHTIDYLVRINLADGTQVILNLATVTLVIEKPLIPEGYEAPVFYDSAYGLKGWSMDQMSKYDASNTKTVIYQGSVKNLLAADNNTVTVTKDIKKINLYGWLGYATTIDKLGYAIDGEATIATDPSSAEQGVINAGGENAKRVSITADISALEVGYHTIDYLVRINMPDGSTAVLKILSFTLIIE